MRRRKTKTEREANAPGHAPSIGFMEWWNPDSIIEPSGASRGGHPDAERVWARKDPGRWTRRTLGISANRAWLVARYRDEYARWVEADRPETEKFISICASPERQVEFAKSVKALLAQIGQPMTKPLQRDYDKGKAPWKEPIDEQKALPEAGVVDAEFTKLDDEEIPF
jgi:hypothetical protein